MADLLECSHCVSVKTFMPNYNIFAVYRTKEYSPNCSSFALELFQYVANFVSVFQRAKKNMMKNLKKKKKMKKMKMNAFEACLFTSGICLPSFKISLE